MCQFELPITESPDLLIQRAKKEIENAGGSLTGNSSEGSFEASTPLGRIQGSYKLLENSIALSITRKPFLLSCKRIQKELQQVMR